jgi:hypothetical protein
LLRESPHAKPPSFCSEPVCSLLPYGRCIKRCGTLLMAWATQVRDGSVARKSVDRAAAAQFSAAPDMNPQPNFLRELYFVACGLVRLSAKAARRAHPNIEASMAHSRSAALTLLLSLILVPGQLVAVERSPQRHDLVLVRIIDAGKPQFVFVVGEVGFRTVAGLKSFVQSLPKDSVLHWVSGCMRSGDEPLLSSDAAMEDFQRHCSKHGVKLVLVPSG